jgi:hypothetical protein
MSRITFALTLFLAGAVTQAAPVPPAQPPPALTPELLAGATWAYAWGDTSGVIALNADGTYFATHSPPLGACYVGTWTVESGRLVLMERSYRPEMGYLSDCPMRYEIALSAAGHPTLTGRCGGTRVVLSEPQR